MGGFVGYSTILVRDEDGVRRITLNRPERRNAMTPEMQEELMLAMEEAAYGAIAGWLCLRGRVRRFVLDWI